MSEISTTLKVVPESLVSGRAQKRSGKPRPVGIFDSGVGGLTVLKQFMKHLPHEDVVYIADTARVPYGGRSPEEIIEINREILDHYEHLNAKLVIMACGTSSSIAYPALKEKYEFPVISLVGPGAREAAASTRNGKIGVIATQGTVGSGSYPAAIIDIKKGTEVVSEACPLFVPLVEGGFLNTDEARKVAKEYMKPMIEAGIDTLVLGCTHYPHMSGAISDIIGPNVVLVDPAEGAVLEAKAALEKEGLLSEKGAKGKISYLVTGPVVQFEEIGSRLLGKPVGGVKQIRL